MTSEAQIKQENYEDTYRKFSTLITITFPNQMGLSSVSLYHHPNNFYAGLPMMTGIMLSQLHFKANSSDIFLATLPKTGTTWLKAILFMIKNRKTNPSFHGHALNTLSPHECVPFLELQVYTQNHILDIDSIPSPRLLAIHVPFGTLPESVENSGCKIVYLCRNPKDTFVSWWHFFNKLKEKSKLELLSIDMALDYFCNGVSSFGPYWDHVLGYWRAHLQKPDQVLFLTYEELKEDPVSNTMKIAEFVGCGFSEEEVKNGVCESIVELCGFENLINSHATTNFFSDAG